MVEGRTHIPVIDEAVCGGCNVCISGCPAEYIPEYRAEPDSLRGVLYSGQAGKRDVRERKNVPPCRSACPIDLATSDYVRLIAEGRFRDALHVIREQLPFPAVVGRICHHPCEDACLRAANVDQAVSICGLKRFVADREAHHAEAPSSVRRAPRGKSVAVIGGGPAGMTCALQLRRNGYAVTIVEATNVLGGMLYWGVPAYRLAKEVLARETAVIARSGIEVRYNTTVGKEIDLAAVRASFDAVFVACGAQRGAKTGIENEDAHGVMSGVEFLRAANGNTVPYIGRAVLVIGGGNVAIDAALTARRKGAGAVTIACLESRSRMPAGADEVRQAHEEGVAVRTGWGPKRIITGNGKVTGVELMRCTSVFDKSGRFNPMYDRDATMRIEADQVIMATGQAPDSNFLAGVGAALGPGGWITADPETLATTIPGLFAGGDIVSGPGMAIEAIAAGKRAAASIDRYLSADEAGRAGSRTGKDKEAP